MRAQKAVDRFNAGFNCSQAVLAAFCEDYGLDSATATKLAVAFGGGLGRLGKACGCITGALMVLGLRYGENSTSDSVIKLNNYDRAKALCERFIEQNGALDCKDIIKFDLSNPEEYKQAQAAEVFKTKCSNIVADTVRLVEDAVRG